MTRELDAKVAEKVLKQIVKGDVIIPSRITHIDQIQAAPLPYYTTDPSADYEVLKHVLETWGELTEKSNAFDHALAEILGERAGIYYEWDNARYYEPGDYSRSALKALGEEI